MTKVRFISTPKAITGKALTIAVGIALATIIHSCSDDRVSDRELTKEYQITEFLTKDVIGKTVFPLVWFDTTSRATQYGIATGAGPNVTINPLDYWVEVIRTGRNIAIRDTCVPDEFTQGGDCIETLLDNGARADAEIGQLQDTIFVRYHIVERSDSTVYIKEVRFLETQLALMARLDNFQAAYRGWRLYGVGRQRHGFGFAATQNFPRIDSIVVESRARQEIRFAAYPDRQATYTWTGRLMVLYDGEPLTVTAYTRPRFNNPPITDATCTTRSTVR